MQWFRLGFIFSILALFIVGCSDQTENSAMRDAPADDGVIVTQKAPDIEAMEMAEPPKGPPTAKPEKKSTGKARRFELDRSQEEGFHRVQVYYATNRNRNITTDVNDFFGTSRGALTYGICEVSIPLTHKTGELESPKWWKMEFSENPEKHVMLQKVKMLDWSAYVRQLNATLSKSAGRNAFIFVHGYNVKFKDAARRTAQIHHDLKFDGAPMFFSWPSQGRITLTSYTHDETNAKWSRSYLKEFLIRTATESRAENIYLVAHSMGTRVLSNAVTAIMAERPDLKKRFREIILAAPDIDADVFVKDLAPKLIEASLNTTLYAASDDKALKTSREVHGGYARAGDAGDNLIVMKGIDTIDATGVDASLLRHSYFAEASSILNDIKELVRLSRPASERTRLQAVKKGDLQFFKVKQ